MTQRWQSSSFTAAFPVANGELILCNSFMGSVARIGAAEASDVRSALIDGIADDVPEHATLRMLCEHGYFVRPDSDEHSLVREVLEYERDSGFSLILLPHENCNFRCVYCYEKFERGKMKRPVVSGVQHLVRRNIERWGSLAVQWFGGEPLLAKDVIRELSGSFMESCDAVGAHYNAGITTNAYLLTPDVARMLIDHRVRRFQITLDGPAEAHNARRVKITGAGTYDRVFRNLAALREVEEDLVVRLRVNFDSDSVDLIEPWLRDIAPVFADDERFQVSFHAIGRWGGPNDASLHVCDEDSSSSARLSLMEAAFAEGFSNGTMREFLGAHGASCYAGKENSIVVGSDGTVYKCTVAFDDPRNHVGTVTPDGDLHVDDEKWRLWVRTDHLEAKKCTSCWFHASCESRTCPLVAMDTGEPPCPSNPKELQDLVELTVYGERITSAVPERPRGPVRRGRMSLPLISH